MIAWNVASQVGALAVAVVLHTLYSIVIARILGPEEFGVYAFITHTIGRLTAGRASTVPRSTVPY